MLHYLGQELHKSGYAMLICDSCNNEEMEKENLQFLLSRKVDGILIFAVSLTGGFLDPAKEPECRSFFSTGLSAVRKSIVWKWITVLRYFVRRRC